jgi:predicted DCC family thiol-disulfide oxidoreductase YuxK
MAFTNKNIILFDGHCNFCDGFIQFILKNESKYSSNLYFCALDTELGKEIRGKRLIDVPEKDSIYYIDSRGNIFFESAAIFKIINQLKIPYKILLIFKFFPKFLKDYFYRLFAKNRYKIFEKKTVAIFLQWKIG